LIEVVLQRKQKLTDENRTVFGVSRSFALDPRDRPKNPKQSGRQPLCHTADIELKKTFKQNWKEVRQAHKKASMDYRIGDHEREFPQGSYRPPIKTIYNNSKL